MQDMNALENLHIVSISQKRTLEDTKATIAAFPGLGKRERGQLKSALNCFARLCGLELWDIEESVSAVRALVGKAERAAENLTRGTFQNIKGKTFHCLELCGHPVLSGRCMMECSPAWRILLDRIPTKPYRVRILPLARVLTERGVEPSDFNQVHVPMFWQEIETRHAKKNPHEIARKAIKMWNACRKEFVFWPQVPIEPISKRNWYTYPEEQFSSGFRDCVTDLVASLVKPPLGRRDHRSPFAKTTARRWRACIYRIASAIARNRGSDPCLFNSLADIADPQEFDGALDYIAKRGIENKTGYFYGMARMIYAIAKHRLGADETDLTELSQIRKSVAPDTGPAAKNIELLLKFRDPLIRERFLLLPETVMTKLKRKKRRSRSDGITAQSCMAASFLMSAPIRSENAVGMMEGMGFIDNHRKRDREIRVDVPADKTKNRNALRFFMGLGFTMIWDDFNRYFRSLITTNRTNYLFPNRDGSAAKRPANLSQQLAKFTSKHLGIRMTAHQWRHVVGYIFLTQNPGCYEPVRRLLGHKRIETTMTFYAFMLDDDAQEVVDDTFEALRQEGRSRYRFGGKRRGTSNA